MMNLTRSRTRIVGAAIALLVAGLGAYWLVFDSPSHHRVDEMGRTSPDMAYLRNIVESNSLSMPQLLDETCGPLHQTLSSGSADQFDRSQTLRKQLIQSSELNDVVVTERTADTTIAQVSITRVSALDHSTKPGQWTVTFNTSTHPWPVCNIEDHTPTADRVMGWSAGQ